MSLKTKSLHWKKATSNTTIICFVLPNKNHKSYYWVVSSFHTTLDNVCSGDKGAPGIYIPPSLPFNRRCPRSLPSFSSTGKSQTRAPFSACGASLLLRKSASLSSIIEGKKIHPLGGFFLSTAFITSGKQNLWHFKSTGKHLSCRVLYTGNFGCSSQLCGNRPHWLLVTCCVPS